MQELFETVDAGVTFQRINKTEAALQLPFLEKVVAMLLHFNKSTKLKMSNCPFQEW